MLTRRLFIAAIAVAVNALPLGAHAQGARRQTRILLLYQQQAETQRMLQFTERLRLTVQELASPVEFYQESLDLERFAGRERHSLVEYFSEKYREFGIDVVVPVGVRALEFAIRELDEVLPHVPIVFALGVAPQIDPSALPGNVTGRLASASRFTPTLSMARGLQPDAKQVVVIGGAGPIDSTSVIGALAAVEALHDTLQLKLLRGLSLDALLRELLSLPRESIILFANYRSDGLGQTFEPIDIIGSLARAASAPMYVQMSNLVGEGVVGGSTIAFDEEGEQTGRLIVRVLHRGPDEPMPPVEAVDKTFVADWRQLRRWELSEANLPRGTRVLFREPSLWQRYRVAVLLTTGVVTAEFLLIGALLVERRRRKIAQTVLEDEQRRSEEAMRQVAHMGRVALVGELAATISHELRQPLAAIRANAETGARLVSTASSDASEAHEIFRSIVADDTRAVEVIESVRKLLRKDEVVVAALDLNQVCQDAVRLLLPDAVRRHIRLEVTPASVTPIVIGDPVQLQQVVLNLLLNALDAAEQSDVNRFAVLQVEREADHVDVIVRDSGPGLNPEVKAQLFKSFYSTKKGGVGLGLVIARSIVERHGGQIRAENHSSGGAMFRVRLPRSHDSSSAQATHDATNTSAATSARRRPEEVEAMPLEERVG